MVNKAYQKNTDWRRHKQNLPQFTACGNKNITVCGYDLLMKVNTGASQQTLTSISGNEFFQAVSMNTLENGYKRNKWSGLTKPTMMTMMTMITMITTSLARL